MEEIKLEHFLLGEMTKNTPINFIVGEKPLFKEFISRHKKHLTSQKFK